MYSTLIRINGDLKIFLAKGGENLKALDDEQDYKLSKEMIAISDDNEFNKYSRCYWWVRLQ